MSTSCMVVGAGLAGLTAANRLLDAGWDVTVVDKGRGVGGRMATRRLNDAVFDHGAQFFTVRDPHFEALVNNWLQTGHAQEWSKGFTAHEGAKSSGQYPRYRGASGMTSVPKALAERLPKLHVSVQIHAIAHTAAGWELHAEDRKTDESRTYTADTLLMTPPAPQTLALMQAVSLPPEVVSALQAITFNPCFAVLAVLDRPSAVPQPGGVYMPGEPLSWIADNQQKGISPVPAVTLHAGPAFTRQHFDTPHDVVADKLIEAARPYLGDAEVVAHQVQRWRYSQPQNMHPEKTLLLTEPGPVAFAGDAFDGARVEGAALSGMAAADALQSAVK